MSIAEAKVMIDMAFADGVREAFSLLMLGIEYGGLGFLAFQILRLVFGKRK